MRPLLRRNDIMVRGNKTDRKNGEHVENILQKIAYHNDKKSGGALFLPSYDLPASERRHFIFDFISLNIEALEISDKLRLVIDVEKYIFRRAIYNANDIINIPPELSGSISDLVQPSNLKKLKVLQKLMICIIDKFRLFGITNCKYFLLCIVGRANLWESDLH
jgi:hypothetical protein